METNQIATKLDIAQAKSEIISFIKQTLDEVKSKSTAPQPIKYLRSKDVKSILGISDNKLKDMRIKGEIPFIKKGSTFFYPMDEFNSAMSK